MFIYWGWLLFRTQISKCRPGASPCTDKCHQRDSWYLINSASEWLPWVQHSPPPVVTLCPVAQSTTSGHPMSCGTVCHQWSPHVLWHSLSPVVTPYPAAQSITSGHPMSCGTVHHQWSPHAMRHSPPPLFTSHTTARSITTVCAALQDDTI